MTGKDKQIKWRVLEVGDVAFALFRALISITIPVIACSVFLYFAQIDALDASLIRIIGSSSVTFSIGVVMTVELATYATSLRSRVLVAIAAVFIMVMFISGSGMYLHENLESLRLTIDLSLLMGFNGATSDCYAWANIVFACTTIALITLFEIRKLLGKGR